MPCTSRKKRKTAPMQIATKTARREVHQDFQHTRVKQSGFENLRNYLYFALHFHMKLEHYKKTRRNMFTLSDSIPLVLEHFFFL